MYGQSEKKEGINWQPENLLSDSIYPQFSLTKYTPFASYLYSEQPWYENSKIKKMDEFLRKANYNKDTIAGSLGTSDRWQLKAMKYWENSGIMNQSQVNYVKQWYLANDSLKPLTSLDIFLEFQKDSTYKVENKIHTALSFPELIDGNWHFIDLGEVLILKIFRSRKEQQQSEGEMHWIKQFFSSWELLYIFERYSGL